MSYYRCLLVLVVLVFGFYVAYKLTKDLVEKEREASEEVRKL